MSNPSEPCPFHRQTSAVRAGMSRPTRPVCSSGFERGPMHRRVSSPRTHGELQLVERLGRVAHADSGLALERLAHIGLLELNSTRETSSCVVYHTPAEALDAIEIRGVLRGHGPRLAVRTPDRSRRRRPAAPPRRADGAARSLTLDSLAHYMDLNESFHAAIVDLAKSPMVARAIQHAVSLRSRPRTPLVFPTSGLAYATRRWRIAKAIIVDIGRCESRPDRVRAPNPIAREHAFIGRRVFATALADSDTWARYPEHR